MVVPDNHWFSMVFLPKIDHFGCLGATFFGKHPYVPGNSLWPFWEWFFCDPFGFLSVTSNWRGIEWSPCFPWKPWRQARHTVVTCSPWSKQWKIDENRKHYIQQPKILFGWKKNHFHLALSSIVYYHHIISNFSLKIMSTFISLKISPIQTLEVLEAQTFALLCVMLPLLTTSQSHSTFTI